MAEDLDDTHLIHPDADASESAFETSSDIEQGKILADFPEEFCYLMVSMLDRQRLININVAN